MQTQTATAVKHSSDEIVHVYDLLADNTTHVVKLDRSKLLATYVACIFNMQYHLMILHMIRVKSLR